MINMVSIAPLTLNLAPNQMKVKNTDMSTNTKHSSKLLKSVDIDIKIVKAQNIQNIYVIFSLLNIFNDFTVK